MNKEELRKKFLEFKEVEHDIEKQFEVFDFLYQELSYEDYQNNMLNILHTYEEISNIGVIDRVEYNEGEILFQETYDLDFCKCEEDALFLTIDLIEHASEMDNPYIYLGAVQAYRQVKKLNMVKEPKSYGKQKYYS